MHSVVTCNRSTCCIDTFWETTTTELAMPIVGMSVILVSFLMARVEEELAWLLFVNDPH